jgi:Stigma-specific protein, Stig1
VGTHTIKIEGKGTGTQVTFDIVNGPTERTIFNFTGPNGVSCPDLISYVPAAEAPVANNSPVTPRPVQGGDTSFPLKISASSNTVQWCDPVTFSVSDTTGTGQLYISFNGPGMPPQVTKWGITIANLVRPAAPSMDWTYTWDTSEHYDGFTKQAAGYTVYAFDENQVHVISMPLQMKGDKLVNGQCPGTVVDYWISGVASGTTLSCTSPSNVITFSGSTGSAVTAGTPVQLKIFNVPTSGLQDLPQSGILIGSTNTDNSGLWKYTWNGYVPGYTLRNGQEYLVKDMLSDTMYTKISFIYQCPTQQCSSNQTNCNGICIMPQNDPSNCGMCGHVCLQGQTCQNGQCVATTGTPTCSAGAMLCNGQCVFVLSNPNNCGSCGNVCVGGQTCVYDTCRCNSGQMFCNGQCIDIMQNSNNCGACGAACGANQYCLNAKCTDKVQGVVTTSAVRKYVPVTTTLTLQIPVPR